MGCGFKKLVSFINIKLTSFINIKLPSFIKRTLKKNFVKLMNFYENTAKGYKLYCDTTDDITVSFMARFVVPEDQKSKTIAHVKEMLEKMKARYEYSQDIYTMY